MKKITLLFLCSFLFSLCPVVKVKAADVGVPSQCEDVMLQAFYWDSYKLDKYGKTILDQSSQRYSLYQR